MPAPTRLTPGSQRPDGELAILALGSNLPPRGGWLDRGREALQAGGCRLVAETPRWHTEPLGTVPQPPFLNQLLLLRGRWRGREWLELAQTAERLAGRWRAVAKAPRTLDVDVILLASGPWDSPDLQVPHPALLERPYLLRGCALLAPDWILPKEEATVLESARRRLRGSWALPLG